MKNKLPGIYIKLKGYNPKFNAEKDYKTSKRPVMKEWNSSIGMSSEEIELWVESGGHIGWVPGENFLVVDIDDLEAGCLIESIYREFAVATIKTPNGYQMIFNTRKSLRIPIKNNTKVLTVNGSLVDYRTSGKGQVVFPYGIEERYFIKEPQSQEFPIPIDLCPVSKIQFKSVKNLVTASDGERNQNFYNQACLMVEYGLDCNEILEILKRVNVSNLPENELEDSVKSALQKAKKEDLNEIREHLLQRGATIDKDEEIDWVSWNPKRRSFLLNEERAAKVINKHHRLIFIGDKESENPLQFIYEGGVYKHATVRMKHSLIKRYLVEKLSTLRNINEVCGHWNTLSPINIPEGDLDPQRYINFKNGLLDLEEHKLIPHSEEIYSTMQFDIDYDLEYSCPEEDGETFNYFIDTLCNHKEEWVKLIHQVMAITLSNIPGHLFKKGLIMIGDGNTGKTQIKNLMTELLGSRKICTSDLHELKNDGFGLQNLIGCRLLGSNDMRGAKIKDISIFKSLIGGDDLTINVKGKSFIKARFKGFFWACGNDYLRWGGDNEEWVYQRMIIMRCDNVPKERDANILQKMLEEKKYIIHKVLQEIPEIMNDLKFSIPEEGQNYIREQKLENSTVLQFIAECSEECNSRGDIDFDITKGEVYKIYREWCKQTGGYAVGIKTFKQQLNQEGLGNVVRSSDGSKNNGSYFSKFRITENALKELNYLIIT